MADLQAAAAATNLLDDFAGRKPQATYKAELMCIVDSRNSGTLITRTEKGGIMIPGGIIMHWTKRLFEWWYLRKYR